MELAENKGWSKKKIFYGRSMKMVNARIHKNRVPARINVKKYNGIEKMLIKMFFLLSRW